MCDKQNANNSTGGIFKRLCRALADGSRNVKSASVEFTALKSNSARVEFAHRLLQDYGLFPGVVGSSKDGKLAVELRQQGNRLFKIKSDGLALVKYTQSIAHAQEKSEDLALAFANRSAVLLEHKLYQECLKDISNAFSNNYPKHLHEKLLQRKHKAELFQSEQLSPKYHEDPPTLTYGPNNLIQCASDCVEIKFEKNLGRHVVATREIQVGDVIAIEQPFSQILLKENYLTHCYHCLRPCYNLIGCDKCPLVLFCGENCKITSWNSSHKYECPILAALLDLEVNKLTLVALKICIHVAKELNKDIDTTLKGSISYKSRNYHEIHNLIANTDLRTTSDLFERAVTAAVIYELIQKNTHFFPSEGEEDKKKTFKELLLLHMQTGPSNFHEISELVRPNENFYEVVEVGAGAYAFLSLLNHSCCPNVVRHCYGSSIVVRALRPIAKGEQLLDNYGYHHAVMSKSERQEHLKQQYHFECKCEACMEDWPLYHDLPTKHFDIAITEEELTKLRNGDTEVAGAVLGNLQTTAKSLERSRPCRELADAQEIIKQCYAIFGNKRVTF